MLVTLQALQRQTKLASPLLPEISVDSLALLEGNGFGIGIVEEKETNETAD